MPEDLRLLREDFTAHTLSDAAFQIRMIEMVEKLATKEDIKDVTNAFTAIKSTGSLAIWIGAIIVGIIAIIGGYKAIINAAINAK